VNKPEDSAHFKPHKFKSFTSTCLACAEKKKAAREQKPNQENLAPKPASPAENAQADHSDSEGGYRGEEMDREDFSDLAEVPLHEFLKTIAEIRKVQTISAKVELTGVENMDAKARADMLAGEIWEQVDYRFMYVFPIAFHIPAVTTMVKAIRGKRNINAPIQHITSITVHKTRVVSISLRSRSRMVLNCVTKAPWMCLNAADGCSLPFSMALT
jgi:hypothetical protein